MKLTSARRWLLQALLMGYLLVVSILVDLPDPLCDALVLLCVVATAGQALGRVWLPAQKLGMLAAWACLPVLLFYFVQAGGLRDSLQCLPVWLAALFILVASQGARDDSIRQQWKALAMACAFFGGMVWLVSAYLNDHPLAFHAGALANLALLIICKRRFRLRAFGIQTANTLILLVVALPLVNFLIYGFNAHDPVPDPAKKYYSYEIGARNPAKFALWWNYFWEQWNAVAGEIQIPAPPGAKVPFRLKPNCQGSFIQSRISINSLGFRGREIPPRKGESYRIVALGESTTFGLTYTADDQPWPELLEQMIRERLKLRRPVEVINAGTASFTIRNNLARLPLDILPLQPDMIISYHGINGFNLIDRSMPPITGKPPPEFRARALRLLANAEFKVRSLRYARQRAAAYADHPQPIGNPMNSDYAAAYRQLIQIAQTNGIRLALANYSMAVNERSDPRVINFYRQVWLGVNHDINANLAHSTVVEQLARQNPSVCFVDTHPGLDGKDEDFVDLVHFTPEGERQMAEAMFAGIRKVLENDPSLSDTAAR